MLGAASAIDPMKRCECMIRPRFVIALAPAFFLLGAVLSSAGNPEELEWTEERGLRYAPLTFSTSRAPGFTRMGPERTGILFTNWLPEARSLTNQVLLNGSGVAAGDIDGDGWTDLYFTGINGTNALYRNLGNWRFEDITAQAGVACTGQASSGAVFADVNGNGHLDLLVNGIGAGTRLFLNDGTGKFREVTREAGLSHAGGSASLALADIDGDGYLDIYVVNYRATTLRDQPDTKFSVSTAGNQFKLIAVNGRPVTAPDLAGRFTLHPEFGVLENGEADILFRNNGDGTFTRVNWTDGSFLDEDGNPASIPYDWGLAAMFRDLTGNGAPDLYVCNDFQSEDRVWINDGQGRFRAIPRLALRQTSLFSMGVDFADLNRNGHDDFFVVDMLSRRHELRQVQLGFFNPFSEVAAEIEGRPQYSRNTLFLNRGDGSYAEIAFFSGLEASDWSWAPVFLDVDLDGYEDLLVTTGHERDAQNADVARQIEAIKAQKRLTPLEQLQLRRKFPRLDTPNYAFRNRGDLTFEEVGERWGFNSTRISHGIALADLDNDGDLDVIINCLNDGPLLYRNNSTAPRVAVRLRGAPPNTQGIGGRIVVRGGAVPEQSQEVISGGRYVSGDDPLRVFAAGTLTNSMSIEVKWRSGHRSLVNGVKPNHLYEINEEQAEVVVKEAPARGRPLFEDLTALIQHVHHDDPYNDFERQPLLPRKLSDLGPGISWFDVDGDGWDDLIIPSGRGGNLAVFRNEKGSAFQRVNERPFNLLATRDQTTVLGWVRQPEERALLVGSSNYEDALPRGAVVRVANLRAKTVEDSLPGQLSSTGPLAMADIDGDGGLDLFVGGRVVPGRYPAPATSLLFRNEGGRLILDEKAGKAFEQAGLISAALWTDLNGDGFPELALACEGGPIRVFQRDGESYLEITERLGLDQFTGWWTSINAGDFDGDGRMDLVAGNWGLNSRYQSYREQPLQVLYGDLTGDGYVEIIEAYFDPELGKRVPWRDWETLSRSLPFVQDRYASFTAFSRAGVDEFLEGHLSGLAASSINTLETMVFLNRGDHFEARALPFEAQLSPVFGVAVADLDGDGHEDIFLSQNFFGVSADQSRHDAGLGVLLLGDGKGGFRPMSPEESGIHIFGEGRGVAISDFDQDGRPDLAVAQNRGEVRLFRNTQAPRGLRVRLAGPVGNPSGIGASVRAVYGGGRMGAARELRAGAGYWSQDSAVMVLSLMETPEVLAITWPGGRRAMAPLPAGAREVLVGEEGQVKVLSLF
jgi:enediyne biosynthesis protein E4